MANFVNKRIYTKKKVTMGRSLGYGILDLMGGGWNTIISAYLLFFLTTFTGLNAAQAGSILLIARFADAVFSLFIGGITDNFYKTKLGQRFGRRHFFILIGVPLFLS